MLVRWTAAWRASALLAALTLTACEMPVAPDDPDAPPTAPTPPPITSFGGCYAAGAQPSGVGCGRLSSLGDPAADAAFASEIAYQRSFWTGVPAQVGLLNDCSYQQRNALAFPDGTILYGYHLFTSLFSQYRNGLPIAGVLAHEWAHQAQFRFGWQNTAAPTVRSTELEADAFAGYYMALAKGWAWGYIDSYFHAVASSGDYNFNHRNHHGTPQERLAAARLGFEAGLYAMTHNRPLSYVELHAYFSQAIGGAFSAERFAAGLASLSEEERAPAQALLEGEAWAIARGETRGGDVTVPRLGRERRQALFPR